MKQYKAIDTETLNDWAIKLEEGNTEEVIREIDKLLVKEQSKGQTKAKLNHKNEMEF